MYKHAISTVVPTRSVNVTNFINMSNNYYNSTAGGEDAEQTPDAEN